MTELDAMRKILILGLVWGNYGAAMAHVGEPSVQSIRFIGEAPGRAWIVVENVGLLVEEAGGFRWLCDEAITPLPGLQDLAITGGDGQRWTAATRNGVFVTEDGGCTFTALSGPLAQHVIGLVSPHGGHAGEALITTQTLGLTNDVYRTTDGGRSWRPAGLELPGRVRALLRAQGDPNVVYITHATGALRSDDGGQSFAPITLGPPGANVAGSDFELLGTRPGRADEVLAVAVEFPRAHLLRTEDGGASWETVHTFDDIPESLVFSADGTQALLSLPFEGLYRSRDGGDTWVPSPAPPESPWLSCLTRAPEGDTIWACARRGGAWLVASSVDFGLTWTPRFGLDFAEIMGSWACEPSTSTSQNCVAACDRSTQACSGGDGGVDLGHDRPLDAGRAVHNSGADAHVSRPATRRRAASSCQTGDGTASLIVGLLLWGGYRRPRKRLI